MVSHTTLKQSFQSLTQISKKRRKKKRKEKEAKPHSLFHSPSHPLTDRPTHPTTIQPTAGLTVLLVIHPTAGLTHQLLPLSPLSSTATTAILERLSSLISLTHPRRYSFPSIFFFFYIKESILHASPLFVYVFLVSGYRLLF